MQRFMRLYSAYGKLVSFMATLAGLAAFAMMWLVDLNVLGRKLFNAPVMGSVEISQSLLVICVMLGMAFAQAQGSHLRVTIIVGHVPPRLSEALFTLAMIGGFILFAIMSYASFGFALRAYNIGEEVWGATFRFPLWPVKSTITLGAALLSGQFLLDAIRVGIFRHTFYHDDIVDHREESSSYV